MKNKTWIIIALVFVLIVVLAVIVYPKLSQKYLERQDNADTEKPSTEQEKENVVQTADFTVYDMQNNKVKLSDYFGKPIVVNFWATWCGYCVYEMPFFNSAYEKYKGDVVFLMISVDEGGAKTVKDFLSANNYSLPAYLDLESNAIDTYGIYSYPQTLFINEDGSLYQKRVGAMSQSELEGYIAKILKN